MKVVAFALRSLRSKGVYGIGEIERRFLFVCARPKKKGGGKFE